jgi:hypothetical protein
MVKGVGFKLRDLGIGDWGIIGFSIIEFQARPPRPETETGSGGAM